MTEIGKNIMKKSASSTLHPMPKNLQRWVSSRCPLRWYFRSFIL